MRRAFLLILIVFSACSGLSKPPSILDMSACGPPCWNDIVVGQTSMQEMLDLVSAMAYVDQKDAFLNENPPSLYDEVFTFYVFGQMGASSNHSMVVQAFIIENKVAELSFCGELGLTFGEAATGFGEPQGIITEPLGEPAGVLVTAINAPAGILFSYHTDKLPRRMRSEISPDVEIMCLSYFDPNVYPKMLETGWLCRVPCNTQETLDLIYPWTGYGNIEEKYPPREPPYW